MSGALRQAHKATPGSRRVRDAEDWLADHLGDSSHAIAGATERPAHRLTPTVERKARPAVRRGRFGRAAIGAVAAGAILIVTLSMVMMVAGKPATAAIVSTPTPSPTFETTSSPTPAPTLTPWPSITPTPTPPRSAAPIAGTVFSAYVVRSGDTLTKIARAFGLSVTTLYWANASGVPNPHLIKIGQSLVVPPVDGRVATVVRDDTLETLADKYGIDPMVIADANSLTTVVLTAGQMLILPGVPNEPLPIPLASGNPIIWLNKLEWPVPSTHHMTLQYGCTTYAAEPRFGKCRHWHNGLDVGAKWGVPVVAAAAGTIIYAGRRKSGTDGAAGGIVVWISHGGTLYTTYNHLSGATVKAGQRVQAGQQVGRIGSSGASSGAHLHFEVWTDYPWTGGSMADAKSPLLYTKWKP